MAITATAGGASASIRPARPSLVDMQKYYLGKNASRDFLYNAIIKGEFTGKHREGYLMNTCSTRMSYALMQSGFALGKTADPEASMRGGDGRWYWIRLEALRDELVKRFKGFDEELKFELVSAEANETQATWSAVCDSRKTRAQQFIDSRLAGKSGIVVFRVAGWKRSTGHFTMWDGHKKGTVLCARSRQPENDGLLLLANQ